MNKKNIGFIGFYIIALVCFIALAFFAGVKVDLLNWTSEITAYVWIIRVGGLISIIALVITVKSKSAKIIKITLTIFIAISLILTFIFTPNWEKIEKAQIHSEKVSEVKNLYEYDWKTLLEKTRIKNAYYLVYVGRNNCSECVAFEPKLEAASKKVNVFVAYYNVIKDRQKNDFSQKMNMLKIKSVPAVIIVGHGRVIKADGTIYKKKKSLETFLENAKNKYKLKGTIL